MSWFEKTKPKTKQDATSKERGKCFKALDKYHSGIAGTTDPEQCGSWIDISLSYDYCRRKAGASWDYPEFICMALLYYRARRGKAKRVGKGLVVSAWLPHDEDGIRNRTFISGAVVPRDPRKVRSLPNDPRVAAALAKWVI